MVERAWEVGDELDFLKLCLRAPRSAIVALRDHTARRASFSKGHLKVPGLRRTDPHEEASKTEGQGKDEEEDEEAGSLEGNRYCSECVPEVVRTQQRHRKHERGLTELRTRNVPRPAA